MDINPLRIDYLNSLSEFQELYLEILINEAQIYKIVSNKIAIGYTAISTDNILIEFYITDNYIPDCADIFRKIITAFDIHSIYCKSFDSTLLNCCLLNSYSYKIKGILFRDYTTTDKISVNHLNIRFANHNDYSFLLQQEGELYETPDELERFVNGNNILMFQRNDQLLGCGYLIKIHKNYDYYDIGMWVNPQHRRQGIATMIISYLKDTCLTNHWKPICGCAVENTASQRTLEKNGFISKHKLIEFTVAY